MDKGIRYTMGIILRLNRPGILECKLSCRDKRLKEGFMTTYINRRWVF